MAELEVAKHGKTIIELAAKREHPIAHKIREILLEIFIIVFAVSLSIWLHGWSEHRHEQEQVRTFLLGLRSDLKTDIAGIKEIADNYHRYDARFKYLTSLDPNANPDAKFESEYVASDGNSFFAPRNSRYEGFRQSGKLTSIEDEKLLNDILALYQEDYPAIQRSQGGWSMRQQKLRDYQDSVLADDSTAEHYRLVTNPKGKRLLVFMIANPQLYQRFDHYAERAARIVKAIDGLYGH